MLPPQKWRLDGGPRSRLPDPQGVGILGAGCWIPKNHLLRSWGAKVSDKIIVIKRLMEKVDALIIGGGMANTFLKAKGMEIGDSLLEEDALETAKNLLMKQKNLESNHPVDVCTAPELLQEVETKFLKVEDKVQAGWKILDIGRESVKQFGSVIRIPNRSLERTDGVLSILLCFRNEE